MLSVTSYSSFFLAIAACKSVTAEHLLKHYHFFFDITRWHDCSLVVKSCLPHIELVGSLRVGCSTGYMSYSLPTGIKATAKLMQQFFYDYSGAHASCFELLADLVLHQSPFSVLYSSLLYGSAGLFHKCFRDVLLCFTQCGNSKCLSSCHHLVLFGRPSAATCLRFSSVTTFHLQFRSLLTTTY